MSVDDSSSGAASVLGGVARVGETPGDMLRQARERAGLTQDDIANKLKLSPRQISAIETGDWSALPERTFTRGFMRSYARLVALDPNSLGLDQSQSQPHAASELKPTPAAIGEIAHEADRNAFSAARVVVPGLLIAALVVGVLYFQGNRWFGWEFAKQPTTPSKQDIKNAAAKSDKADAVAAKSEAASTSSGSVIAPAASTPAAEPAVAAAILGAATDVSSAATPAANLAAAPGVAGALTANLPVPVAAGDKRISLLFKGKSWTEVRSKGEVIFSETAAPGSREFSGTPPLSFTVGNASNVVVSIDGKPYDMSELTRNDVARFRVE